VDAKELGAQGASAREKKQIESKVPNQRSMHDFKGIGLTLHFQHRARRVSKTFAHNHARAPTKQPPATAMPRFPRDADLQSLRAVMTEWSRRSRRPRCPRP
jgi:hypothetical protein